MKHSGAGFRGALGLLRTVALGGLAFASVASSAQTQAPSSARQQQSIVNTTKSNTKDRIAAPPNFTVTGTYRNGMTRYFELASSRDSDADGHFDAGLLRVACGDGGVQESHYLVNIAGTEMVTGKQQHPRSLVGKQVRPHDVALGSKLSLGPVQAKGIQENGIRRSGAIMRRNDGDGHREASEEWSEVAITSGAEELCRT